MPSKSLLSAVLLLLLFSSSCTTREDFNPSPLSNYKALWKILDEGYCYFDEKLPADSTWEMMYDKHLSEIREDMTPVELMDALAELTYELRDGHVGLISSFDRKAYINWRSDYPSNVNPSVRNRYLGDNYRIAGTLYYAPITYNGHEKDKVGLIYYSSFSGGVGHGNINAVLNSFKECRGIIIDVRNNGGGNVSNVETIAGHFAADKTLVGYMSYKSGPRHNDFSTPTPLYIEPVESGILWHRPVVVLTNRGMYSAANDFALYMKQLPYATLLGDTTGGGGGLPRGSELPIGWRVVYSGSKTTDPQGNSIEFGIPPSVEVSLSLEDDARGVDTLIEEAIGVINNFYKEKSGITSSNPAKTSCNKEDFSSNVSTVDVQKYSMADF